MTETVELAKEAIPYHRKINGKSLTQDIHLTAADVKAVTPEALRVDIPVGVPLPWPTDRPPTGWLLCNGDRFNATQYPLLASAYPSGQLPDLRGEFIRGADAGRKIDTGRKVLSAQGDAIRNITGQFGYVRQGQWGPWVTATGAFYQTSTFSAAIKRGDPTGAPSLRLMPPGLSPPPTKTGLVMWRSTTLFEALELDAFVEYPASTGTPLAPKAGEIAWPEVPQG